MTRRELRHDPAVGAVHGVLRGYDARAELTVDEHRSSGIVARGFDAEDDHDGGSSGCSGHISFGASPERNDSEIGSGQREVASAPLRGSIASVSIPGGTRNAVPGRPA